MLQSGDLVARALRLATFALGTVATLLLLDTHEEPAILCVALALAVRVVDLRRQAHDDERAHADGPRSHAVQPSAGSAPLENSSAGDRS